MGVVERVQAILLKPKETWPVIAAEPSDAAAIYRRYLVILAAIPALAGFIGFTLIGVSGFGFRYRLPITTGLVQLVVGYLLSLAMVYVLALIVNALAPTFGGTKDLVAALKLVAYASTASFVAGIFSLLPSLAFVGLLGGLYSIYLVYAGIALLMRCPPDKAGGYTTVVIICAILAGVVLVGVTSLFVGHGPTDLGTRTVGVPGLPGGDVQIKTPDGATVTINPGAMAEMAKRMEEAGKRIESAQSSGDTAAAGKAMGDILGAVTGGGNAAPIASADLKAMLPEAIGDMKRSGVEAQTSGAMGISASTAKASYGADDRRVELSIIDGGGLAGLAALAGWANLTMDQESDGKVEKVYKDGARTIHEEYRKDASHGEMTVVLANGVIVSAEGSHVDMATLKDAVASVGLAKIEATKRSARQ
jgi:Yip1 domain